jgi:hypothetical protein
MTDTHQLGLERAKQAADRAGDNWKGAAYQAFIAHAQGNKRFTTEEVRKAFPDLPAAPDQRAWGHIAKAVERADIIEAVGYKRAQSSNGRVSVLWESKLI